MIPDGNLQVHRRQGRLSKVLPEEAVDAIDPRNIGFG